MAGKRKFSSKGSSSKKSKTYHSSKKLAVMKHMVTPEMKEVNTYAAAVTPAVGGQIAIINQCAEGTDYNNRIGRKIIPQYCQADIIVQGPTSIATSPQDFVQIALVWDKQPNASNPTFGTIFDISSATPAQAFKLTANWRDRFEILWLEKVQVQNVTGASGDLGNFNNTYFRKFFKFNEGQQRVEFQGTGASTPSTGALYLAWGTLNNTNSAVTSAQVTYNTRFTFFDA